MIAGDLNLHSNVSPKRRDLTFTMLYFADLIPDNAQFFELLSHLHIICLWFIWGLIMWPLGSNGFVCKLPVIYKLYPTETETRSNF